MGKIKKLIFKSTFIPDPLYASLDFEDNVDDAKGNLTTTGIDMNYQSDSYGQCIKLNGSTSRVDLGESLTGGRTEFTIAMLFRADTTKFYNTLFGSWVAGAYTLQLTIRGGRVYVAAGVTNGGFVGSSSGYFFDYTTSSEWKSIILTFSPGAIKCYMDGVKFETDISIPSDRYIAESSGPDSIGCYNTSDANTYGTHYIDKFRFYDVALTSEQCLGLSDELLEVETPGRFMSIVGYSAPIKYSSDYGVTWKNSNSPITSWFSIAMSNDGKYQLAGNVGGYAYLSIDGGETWNFVYDLEGTNTYCAVSGDGKYMMAAAYAGKVAQSSDYGVTWSTNGSISNMRGVAISEDGKYQMYSIYLSDSGVSDDYGASFTSTGLGSLRYYRSVMCNSGEHMLLPTLDGITKYSGDYGVTWSDLALPVDNYYGGAVSGDGKYILVCTNAAPLYLSKDFGVTFTDISDRIRTGTESIHDVAMSDTGQVIIVYNRGLQEKFVSIDFGVTFRQVSTPEPPCSDYGGVALNRVAPI